MKRRLITYCNLLTASIAHSLKNRIKTVLKTLKCLTNEKKRQYKPFISFRMWKFALFLFGQVARCESSK